jgi:hypothetical protein
MAEEKRKRATTTRTIEQKQYPPLFVPPGFGAGARRDGHFPHRSSVRGMPVHPSRRPGGVAAFVRQRRRLSPWWKWSKGPCLARSLVAGGEGLWVLLPSWWYYGSVHTQALVLFEANHNRTPQWSCLLVRSDPIRRLQDGRVGRRDGSTSCRSIDRINPIDPIDPTNATSIVDRTRPKKSKSRAE